MASRWYKNDSSVNRRRHTLHSLGVGFVFFAFLYAFTNIFSVSLCPLNNLFGISCFGCGLTRGFIAVLNLDPVSALQFNVLSIPLFFSIFMYCLLAIIDFIFNKDTIYIIEKQLSKKYMYPIYVIILITVTVLNNR